jgi:hypothetical protein
MIGLGFKQSYSRRSLTALKIVTPVIGSPQRPCVDLMLFSDYHVFVNPTLISLRYSTFPPLLARNPVIPASTRMLPFMRSGYLFTFSWYVLLATSLVAGNLVSRLPAFESDSPKYVQPPTLSALDFAPDGSKVADSMRRSFTIRGRGRWPIGSRAIRRASSPFGIRQTENGLRSLAASQHRLANFKSGTQPRFSLSEV